MKNLKFSKLILCAVLAAVMLVMAGCNGTEQTADPGIADGTYVATFTTDNPMFHVCEANQDRGILTVADGKMTIHVSLQSKKIVNLYPGPAEEASKEGADEAVDTGAGFGADNVSCQIAGLGRITDVQKVYVDHTAEAMAQ